MKHKDCRWIEKHLIEIVEGSIKTKDVSLRIEGHLRFCSKCSSTVERFQMAWEMLENPERIEVSHAFEDSLMEKIGEIHKDNIFAGIREGFLKALRPAMLAAGLFLALFFGYHLGNFPEQEPFSMSPGYVKEAGYMEYSSGDLIILDDYSQGLAADFLLSYKVTPKEDSP